jgi:hypothetical protein
MRYNVRQIRYDSSNIENLGKNILSSETFEEAIFRIQMTIRYDIWALGLYGVAIVDNDDEIIFWGDCVTDFYGNELGEQRTTVDIK